MRQGSILGPLLFNILSGNLFLFVKHIDIVNIADDAVGKNPENLLRACKIPQFTLIPKKLISTIFLSTKTTMLERKLSH